MSKEKKVEMRISELEQRKGEIIEHFFTDEIGEGQLKVVAIKDTMPGVIAGWITARKSRAEETDVREVFWQELVVNPDVGLEGLIEYLVVDSGWEKVLATKEARAGIRRVLDRFGDDSVREQGSGYVAVDGASALSMMEAFEHPLITGIGASTRYIDFAANKDSEGRYRFVRPERIMSSEYGELYEEVMNNLFLTYERIKEPVWEDIVKNNPNTEGVSEAAYQTALRGAYYDVLRKLLPLGVENSFMLHGHYRVLTEVCLNLRASETAEGRAMGESMAKALSLVNPEFVEIAQVGNSKGDSWVTYQRMVRGSKNHWVEQVVKGERSEVAKGVEVNVLNENWLEDLVGGVLAQRYPGKSWKDIKREAKIICRESGNGGPVYERAAALREEFSWMKEFKLWERGVVNEGTMRMLAIDEQRRPELVALLRSIGDARGNRRHKLPEEFEGVGLVVEFNGISYSSYKDFQRQRKILWRTEPDWDAPFGVYIPASIERLYQNKETRWVFNEFVNAQRQAHELYQILREEDYLQAEARYVLTHGMTTSFKMAVGLGEENWIDELRSIASGDPEYRHFAWEMYRQKIEAMPELIWLRSYVDMNDYPLGRIREAVRADLDGAIK